jgi:hypothetical protein
MVISAWLVGVVIVVDVPLVLEPELPDFSWYNIPKRGKIYQMTTKWPYIIPFGRKIDKNGHKNTNIFHCKTFQN